MADFNIAYAKLALVEGLYSNDPNDKGGETVCGIARNYWPKWEGWAAVDAAKRRTGFPGNLKADQTLAAAVRAFYRANFWACFSLDAFDQALADEAFEQAVNLGASRMVKHLQRVLNALNYQSKFGADLTVDGAFGPKSLIRLKQAVADGRARAVQYGINGLQCAYYVELAEKNLTQRKYTGGWLAQRGEAKAP